MEKRAKSASHPVEQVQREREPLEVGLLPPGDLLTARAREVSHVLGGARGSLGDQEIVARCLHVVPGERAQGGQEP